MSELSENLHEWPRDPYELLGVDHEADERTVRKAYLRLVRLFKPEFYPEHFQRIREAYDDITNHLTYYREFAEPDSLDAFPSSETVSHNLCPHIAAEDPLDAAWREAMEGRERDAYSKLVRMVQRGESVAEACIRLYWLQFAAPELYASIDPCHWLVEGLRDTRLTGPMFGLYADEIAANPAEVKSTRCSKLAEVNCDPGRLYDFMQIRWRACDRLADYVQVTTDLTTLKDRFGYRDEVTWLRLMLLAATHLAWGDDHALKHFGHLTQSISQARCLDHEIGYELDRMDLLIEITQRRNALRYSVDVPPSYLELVEQSWVRSYEEFEPALRKVVAMIAKDPQRALKHIDHLKRANQAAASHLVDLIRSQYASNYYPDSKMTERAMAAAKRFLYQLKKADYPSARTTLLQASLDEAIDPVYLAQFADQVLADPHATGWWMSAAGSDISIQGVYYGCRTVWG